MAIGIQDQYFGTEIEMTGITRQRAAEKVAELFGTRAVCDGGYYGVWSVTDQEGKKWKFMYDGSIYTERRERGRMVPAGREYSTEMVSPKLSYREMGKLQEVVRCLRHHGAKVNASCGQHVHVDASNHTPRSLKNAMTIMYSKEDILFKALKVQTSREQEYCQKVRPIVLEKIRRMPNSTISMEKLKRVWYGGRDGSHDHYDDTRYYALNLHAVFSKGTLEWRCFESTLHAGKVRANITLALAISAQAINQKCTQMRKTEITENPAFTFRTFLLRLGLIGPEYKNVREHLLANLEGDRAWRYDRSTYECLNRKDTIYSPDGAKDEQGNPVIRYEKDDLVATLVTDSEGKAVVNNLPLGSYYLKETVAGDHFVLNPEQKEFTLTVEDDTQAVVYEGVAYKNERQKISISVEKKDAVTEEKLEGVIFGLYAKEDILSQQGEVLVEKDTLLEKKATDEKGQLTFDSDLYHGKYYVKEEVRKPGYLPNEEIWEMDASYTDQNLAEIKLTKEVENQPTESQFTKTDATTGEELEGAKLQIIDKEGNIVEEWISAKEPHVVYGLPEGTYILHEELPPYAEGYVSAEDIEFEVKEDGSVTKVEMKDDYSKVEISKTDITTGEELEGAKLQILNKEGEILEEWVTDGKPHPAEKLPVGEELTLREITAPEGYEIAEDVKFTLEDTMEIQKVEMKDARTPETPGVPQTGDDHWKPILLFVLLGASAAGLMATMIYKKKHGKTEKADETKKEE